MSELTSAIKQICDEKNLSYDAVIETIESALAAAYRKDYGEKNQNIKVEFDPETAKSKVFDVKTVVEDMPEEEIVEGEEGQEEVVAEDVEGEEIRKFNPKTEIQISEAKELKKTYKIGDEIKTKLEVPESYGRMAAQTAKQVIIQKLREAEREMVFSEFKDKEHEVITGVVQRREGRIVLVDLGKSTGVLGPNDQIYNDKYEPGNRIKVYVRAVNVTPKGPEIVLSRTSEEILKKVFYLEIPEISNGLVELKAVAREAGSRSKVAVSPTADNIDPIGSCVGQRGARIQTIISELGGEKIDIIEYSDDVNKYIANALSPAKIVSIKVNKEEQKAIVSVASDQLSLAIGKGGQNVRLAAQLTGWKIDIIDAGEGKKVKIEDGEEEVAEAETSEAEVEKVKEESTKTAKEDTSATLSTSKKAKKETKKKEK